MLCVTFTRCFMHRWWVVHKALRLCSIFQKNFCACHTSHCTGIEQRGDSINRRSIDLQAHFYLFSSFFYAWINLVDMKLLKRTVSPQCPPWIIVYICSCVDERSSTGDMVSNTGLMKGCHVVYCQNIYTVTLDTDTEGRRRQRHYKRHEIALNLCLYTCHCLS